MHCEHTELTSDIAPKSGGCEACLARGDTWVSLRVCAVCGHVGCCDSSKNRHARAHFVETDHPIMRPMNGPSWLWCYQHDSYVNPDGTLR